MPSVYNMKMRVSGAESTGRSVYGVDSLYSVPKVPTATELQPPSAGMAAKLTRQKAKPCILVLQRIRVHAFRQARAI